MLPEFSTMAGRRLRDAVKTVLTDGVKSELSGDIHIVIAGLTNSYSQYVTTFEEYQVQRYEVSSPCRELRVELFCRRFRRSFHSGEIFSHIKRRKRKG